MALDTPQPLTQKTQVILAALKADDDEINAVLSNAATLTAPDMTNAANDYASEIAVCHANDVLLNAEIYSPVSLTEPTATDDFAVQFSELHANDILLLAAAELGNGLKNNLIMWADGATVNGTYKQDSWGDYHFDTFGTVAITSSQYDFDGNDANYLRRPDRDAGSETTGTLSGCVEVVFDSVAANAYLVGKDGNKGSEYGWRVYFNQASDCFNIEFWDDTAATDRVVQVGSSITTATSYKICYGYDVTAGEIWASLDGGTEVTASYTLTQGSNNGYIAIGRRADNATTWATDGRIKNVGLWSGYRLTAADQDLIATSPTLADFDWSGTEGFSWDFESTSSYVGRLTRDVSFSNASLSASSPITGSASALNTLVGFSQIQVFNDSIQPFWGATCDEGRVDFDLEMTTYGDGSMVFMIDGKGVNAVDNNNGIALYFDDTNAGANEGFRFRHSNNGAAFSINTDGYDVPVGTVVSISMRWNINATGNTMELYADDVLVASSTGTLTNPSDALINHMSIMNDTVTTNVIKEDSLVVTGDSGLT